MFISYNNINNFFHTISSLSTLYSHLINIYLYICYMENPVDSIQKSIAAKNVAPVYYVHGEEGFFIDRIVNMFSEYLPEPDRPFNMFTFYAAEKSPDDVMDICRRYPMMADKLLVIVREAQTTGGKWLNKLAPYVAAPSPSTILVVAARGENPSCKEFTNAVKKGGGIDLEFKKPKDSAIDALIIDLLKKKQLNCEPKALVMLKDYVGTDLSRIHNEISKLSVALGEKATVTPESVECLIGVSTDYNNFELRSAIAARNYVKALKIAKYFTANPKKNPWVVTSLSLFDLFSSALIAYYTPGSDMNLVKALGARGTWALNDVLACKKNYNPWQLIDIISLIRRFDARAKGNGSRQDAFLLQEELIMDILTSPGRR